MGDILQADVSRVDQVLTLSAMSDEISDVSFSDSEDGDRKLRQQLLQDLTTQASYHCLTEIEYPRRESGNIFPFSHYRSRLVVMIKSIKLRLKILQ
jgi:hypothetical protein